MLYYHRHEIPSCTADKPSLLSHLMDATLPQGSTHMFVCAASAIPFPFFVFRFNGERITFNSSERTVITTDTHATLTLFNLQGTDEGTYNCSVSNRFGSVSTAALLTVQGVLGLGRIYREVCMCICTVCTYACGDTREGKSNCWHVVVAHVKFMYIIAVVMLHGKRSQE